MATFITLMKFTEQGVRAVKDTVKRADAAREAASRYGVSLKSIHWTLGRYDVLAVWDAPDEASITAFNLSIASAGNVHTETLRGFDRDEMSSVLAKMS